MRRRSARALREGLKFSFRRPEFQIESYLRYQGEKFGRVLRIPTPIWRITKALDYFDPAARDGRPNLARAARAGQVGSSSLSFHDRLGGSRPRARGRSSRRASTTTARPVVPRKSGGARATMPSSSTMAVHGVVRAYSRRVAAERGAAVCAAAAPLPAGGPSPARAFGARIHALRCPRPPRPRAAPTSRRFAAWIKPGSHVLDLGSATAASWATWRASAAPPATAIEIDHAGACWPA